MNYWWFSIFSLELKILCDEVLEGGGGRTFSEPPLETTMQISPLYNLFLSIYFNITPRAFQFDHFQSPPFRIRWPMSTKINCKKSRVLTKEINILINLFGANLFKTVFLYICISTLCWETCSHYGSYKNISNLLLLFKILLSTVGGQM